MSRCLFRKILVASDGSEPARKAFDKGLGLAVLTGAELHVISMAEDLPRFAGTVGEVEDYKRRVEAHYRTLGEELQREAARHDLTLQVHVLYGHEVEGIVTFAKKNHFDLLVIGFVGHSNVLKKLMGNWGSTAQNLTRLAPCTVLVVK
ncbi:MAG: universal stress protein [Planctomycetaceae bacterium]|nr:universal stress protein [Planctomycetaceae bacterium]